MPESLKVGNLFQRLPVQTMILEAGKLGVVEGKKPVPFQLKRIYFIYDVPTSAERGAHAHKELSQFFIALNGSFTLTLDSGNVKEQVKLSTPSEGVLIGPGLWRELSDFSEGAVCLVLASHEYSEEDYIRNYEEFEAWVQTAN